MNRPKKPVKPAATPNTSKTPPKKAAKPKPSAPAAAAKKPVKPPVPTAKPAAPSKAAPPKAAPSKSAPPKTVPSKAPAAKAAPAKESRPARETLERPIAAESVGGLESPDSGYPPSGAPSEEPPAPRKDSRRARGLDPDPAVVAQIRELEAQLDRLIDEASRHDVSSLDPDDDVSDLEETRHLSSAELDEEVEITIGARAEPVRFDPEATMPAADPSRAFDGGAVAPPAPPVHESAVPAPPESVFDTARELLSTDFYLRKWGRLAMRGRSEEVDDFGFDPVYDEKYRPYLEFLYTKYFRVETSGIENIPSEGRCVLVANHSGTLPLDGVMMKTAVKREHPAARDLRWLTEDFISHMPFLGSTMNRLGAVRACQENAERLLENDALVAVFPEGVKGIGKLFGERYRLQRFGRGGFIKLCLRTSTPIVPVAVVGAEETNPMLFRVEQFSKALGLPYLPITPTFPLLGPAGLLPAPTKWRIVFGEPLDLSAHGPEAADDEILVGKLAERVRASIQGMLDRTVSERKSVFFG